MEAPQHSRRPADRCHVQDDPAQHDATAAAEPRWWAVPLVLSATAGMLGLAVLLPWTSTQAQQAAARGTWVALQQAVLVALIIMAWRTPRPGHPRHRGAARATVAAIGFQLALSVWDNQLGGAFERYGTPGDMIVRSVLTAAGGGAIVLVLATVIGRRTSTTRRDVAAIIDATVVSAAAGLLVWEAGASGIVPTDTRTMVVASAVTVVVASTALLVRLLLSSRRDRAAVRLLSVGLVLGMTSVVVFSLDAGTGARPHSHRWELPLLFAYATLVSAVLHPSMRDVVDGRERERQADDGTLRALVLSAAVVTPAAVALAGAIGAVGGAAPADRVTEVSLPSALAGLVVAVGGAWRLTRLIRERARSQRMLEHRSRHDDLTGLPNRAFLLQRLREAVARQRARPATHADGFGLMLLDIDNFTSINDSYGHEAGDLVLVNVARRLAGAVRTDDLAGRMAGDEFVLLCGQPSDEASLAGLADRVRATVEAPMPLPFGVVTPRVSIGVTVVDHALASAEDAVSAILRAADVRMHESKRAARGAGALPATRPNLPDRDQRRARDEAT